MKRSFSVTAAALVVAMSVPASAQDQGEAAPAPPPPEDQIVLRYPPSSSRWKIIVAGAGAWAFGYGASAAMGGIWSDIPGRDWLFVPVIGPWAALGNSGCAPDEESTPGQGDCEPIMALRGVLWVVDGLLQAGGLGIVAEGIFMTTESEEAAPAPKKATIMPTPIAVDRGVGFGVRGTF